MTTPEGLPPATDPARIAAQTEAAENVRARLSQADDESGLDDGAALAGLLDEAEPAQSEPPGPTAKSTGPVLDRDGFFHRFKLFHELLVWLALPFLGHSLGSLRVKPEEEPAARQVSDLLYGTFDRVPWFHWALRPGIDRHLREMQLVWVYAAAKASAAAAELSEKRAKALSKPPANDDVKTGAVANDA